MRVLIVEDEVKMAGLIRRGLREEGLAADVATTARTRSGWPAATDYDAIVLDVMLPGIDGFETCRRLRADGVWAPVLMLTARDGVEDRVAGLDGGADDYLTQAVLVRRAARAAARARAARRRSSARRCCAVGDLRLDPATRQVVARRGRRSSSRRRSSRCWRRSCAARARCSRATSCSSTPGTTSTRTARTSSTSTCATCARRSTGRSARARSRPCAAPATGCGDGRRDRAGCRSASGSRSRSPA